MSTIATFWGGTGQHHDGQRLATLPVSQITLVTRGRFPRVFGDKFGEEFCDKFGDEFSESPNLVMN